jgi:hypothetical protein
VAAESQLEGQRREVVLALGQPVQGHAEPLLQA